MKNVNFSFGRAAGAVLCAAIVITAFAACENLVGGGKGPPPRTVTVYDAGELDSAVSDPTVSFINVAGSFKYDKELLIYSKKTISIPPGDKLTVKGINAQADLILRAESPETENEETENETEGESRLSLTDIDKEISKITVDTSNAGVLLVTNTFYVKTGAGVSVLDKAHLAFIAKTMQKGVVDGTLAWEIENSVYQIVEGGGEPFAISGEGSFKNGSNEAATVAGSLSLPAVEDEGGGEDEDENEGNEEETGDENNDDAGGGNNEDNGNNGQQSPDLTANISFVKTDGPAFLTGPTEGDNLAAYTGEGSEQAWTVSVVEEPVVYFAVSKEAGQTVTVGGADAAKVRQAGSGETLDGTEAGDTLAVFAVEMEDLLFDGDFESAAHNGEHGGKESRAITLNVTEDGKEPVSVALTLNMTLDVDSDVTMFHKEDGKWKKIRNAQNVITQANMRKPTNVNDPATWAPVYFSAGDSAPVSDLKGAFAYIDNYAEPGSGEGAVAGTPAGYSEYRIFVKAKENIINMTHLSLKDYVSIELYGAGNAGSEKIIKRDYNQSNKNMGLNYDSGINNIGGGGDHWITVSYTKPQGFSINTNHRMLTLEKNITLDGGGCDGKLIEEHTNIDARYMIAIYANGTLVMREGSKITGVISNKRAYPIIILRADSQFYMYGGEISGNRLVYSYGVGGVILLHNEATIDNVHVSTRAVIEQNYIITDPNNPNSTFEENGAATGATEIDIPRDQNL